MVDTGGGFQVYWISKAPLLPHEWHPYADGLKQLLLANNFKFDPTCTADSPRILRMPGTVNRKYTPAIEAQLLQIPLKLYDFTTLDFLKQHAGKPPAPTAQAHQLFADPNARTRWTASRLAQSTTLRSSRVSPVEAGIDKFGDNLVDPLPIFQQCGFYHDALLTGGKDHDQPLWNLAVLGTTFMEKGDDIAHTEYRKTTRDIPRTTHRRSMIARWLKESCERNSRIPLLHHLCRRWQPSVQDMPALR